VLPHVVLLARPGLRTAPQPVELLWNARFALPAGEYRVELRRPAPTSLINPTLGLQIGRVGPPLEEWRVDGDVSIHRLVLPIDAIFVGFRGSPDLAQQHGELRISPALIVDEGRRVRRPAVLSARRYGAVTAFFHDDSVVGEPSGYWTHGRARTEVTLAVEGSSPERINAVLHCGPVANRVTLRTPGWEETLALEAGVARPVRIPTIEQTDLGIRVAALDITVENGFVPAELDPASADRRLLGCWMELQTPG
jgi:hypothetical protein